MLLARSNEGYNMPNVICSFPGTGKSTVVKDPTVTYVDLDSSEFHGDEWPQNYIDKIKSYGKYDIVIES